MEMIVVRAETHNSDSPVLSKVTNVLIIIENAKHGARYIAKAINQIDLFWTILRIHSLSAMMCVCVCGAFPLLHAHESFSDRARKIDNDETSTGTIHVKCKLLNAVDCIRSSLICFILQ